MLFDLRRVIFAAVLAIKIDGYFIGTDVGEMREMIYSTAAVMIDIKFMINIKFRHRVHLCRLKANGFPKRCTRLQFIVVVVIGTRARYKLHILLFMLNRKSGVIQFSAH